MGFITIFSLAFVAVIFNSPAISAQQDNTKTDAVSQSENNQTSEITYKYTAQPGDSYSKIARKAVQTYGLKENVKLTLAQVVYAETNLTLAAQSPELSVGQKLSIKESEVKNVVDKAQKLTDAQERAWNYYVQFINFNTDKVGQSS